VVATESESRNIGSHSGSHNAICLPEISKELGTVFSSHKSNKKLYNILIQSLNLSTKDDLSANNNVAISVFAKVSGQLIRCFGRSRVCQGACIAFPLYEHTKRPAGIFFSAFSAVSIDDKHGQYSASIVRVLHIRLYRQVVRRPKHVKKEDSMSRFQTEPTLSHSCSHTVDESRKVPSP